MAILAPSAVASCRPLAAPWLPRRSIAARLLRRLRAASAAVAPPHAARTAPRAQLVDPAAEGARRVAVAPRKLADIRQAEAFGPRGVLLIGLSAADCQAVQDWLQAIDPDCVVSPCPAALLLGDGTLRQAVGSGPTLPALPYEAQPADAPPVAFFSGLSGEEQLALLEGWAEHTGLQAPAFASVTASTIDKPLKRLLADIVRAHAQQPHPGLDPKQIAAAQAAAASCSDALGGAGSDGLQQQAADAQAGAGGEQVLRSKLQNYVMLSTGGETETAPMSLEALKEQIQEKVRQKKAAAAAAERAARKEASQDETDRMRQALKGGKKRQQGSKSQAGGSPSKGFGSK